MVAIVGLTPLPSTIDALEKRGDANGGLAVGYRIQFALLDCCCQGFKFFRFVVTKVRGGDTVNGVSLGQLLLRREGVELDLADATAENPDGQFADNEGPGNAIDGRTSTRWHSSVLSPLLIKLPKPVLIDSFSFRTGPSDEQLDPVEWRLEASNDQNTWKSLHSQVSAGAWHALTLAVDLPNSKMTIWLDGEVALEFCDASSPLLKCEGPLALDPQEEGMELDAGGTGGLDLKQRFSLCTSQACPWHDRHAVGMARALLAVLLLVSGGAQRLKEYNLWVCPHCERGVKVADVTDLSCEVSSTLAPSGHEWPWVKKALRNFLRSFHLPPEKRAQHEVDELIKLASAPLQGECYLGIVALGFFVFHFMDPAERQNLIRTSVFGGVTFQKAVPLSYWDVYASGWPIFGLLATAAETVQHDLQTSRTPASQPDLGMTGIDLGKRDCCDFPGGSAAVEDRRFLVALGQSLQGTAWLASDATSPALPLRSSLEYLSQTAYRRCSWGRAAAYFAAAESLLVTSSQLSQAVWNSTKALVALGEHNLDGCESNMTVYHQMQSIWPFWQILGRLEARALSVEAPASSSSPSLLPPPALPEAVGLKWQRLLGSRGLKVDEQPLPKKEATLACLSDSDGFAHVALSADLAQIDGLIVTLQSAVTSAANASSLCFHAFVLPHQKDFVIEGLRCAFAEALLEDGSGRGLSWPILGTFRLQGRAQLILHGLDSDHIWAEVGMNSTSRPANHSASAIMLGETDLSNSLRSDTGNLGAVHNFARFSLHTLLPGLSRVVYLDVDVVVKGDLAGLYNVNMSTVNGAPGTVAAVQRSNQPLRTYVDVLQPAVPSWLPSEAPSFNAGVMVIDLARWRQRHASRLVAEWIELNSRRRLWLHGSQPPLLLLFHDEVVSLHWSWNVDGLGHRLNYPKHVLAEAKVLHWTGPLKPWRHHGVNRKLWEPHTREYCPKYSNRVKGLQLQTMSPDLFNVWSLQMPHPGIKIFTTDSFEELLEANPCVFLALSAAWFALAKLLKSSTEVMNIDENDVDKKYFPERHIPVIKLLVKKPPEDDGLDHSNDKPVVISYEGGHDIASWLQFLGEHTELKLQDVLDQNLVLGLQDMFCNEGPLNASLQAAAPPSHFQKLPSAQGTVTKRSHR
ncbi:Galacturonosyltransferase 8 [Symbiodinium microadriaticum]|uniref:Galacturonosyltransferase 8 n=1 Tax=Symbiodinium microadriaticum TaxID=2951 RepID=A0A1Q9F578_SYMMI|nr:Galacturonosyltransferase 8 [Symbiodinium microadriaticum]